MRGEARGERREAGGGAQGGSVVLSAVKVRCCQEYYANGSFSRATWAAAACIHEVQIVQVQLSREPLAVTP